MPARDIPSPESRAGITVNAEVGAAAPDYEADTRSPSHTHNSPWAGRAARFGLVCACMDYTAGRASQNPSISRLWLHSRCLPASICGLCEWPRGFAQQWPGASYGLHWRRVRSVSNVAHLPFLRFAGKPQTPCRPAQHGAAHPQGCACRAGMSGSAGWLQCAASNSHASTGSRVSPDRRRKERPPAISSAGLSASYIRGPPPSHAPPNGRNSFGLMRLSVGSGIVAAAKAQGPRFSHGPGKSGGRQQQDASRLPCYCCGRNWRLSARDSLFACYSHVLATHNPP